MTDPTARLFVAIDTPDPATALTLAGKLRGRVGGLKLGLEFFCAGGPSAVRVLAEDLVLPLFLDLKFHDIPNTVAGAVRSVVPLRPAFLTVHAAGGPAMLRAAAEAARDTAAKLGVATPRLLAVTVLTSLEDSDLRAVGQSTPAVDQVMRLAALAQANGMDGVVCSPAEVAALRSHCGPDFLLMVPGIRPVWAAAGDQKRVMTPAEAVRAGADRIVVGRPITSAADPAAAAAILAELEGSD